MRTSLIILTLNERPGLTPLFRQIPLEAVDECFVVDGGSTDGTIEFFREHGVRVIVQPASTRGKGEGIKLGIAHATGDVVVLLSGDGNERAGDIRHLMKTIEEGYDFVIASRFLPQSKSHDLTPIRWFGNRAFTALVNLRWGTHLTDVFNSFRAIRRRAAMQLQPQASGFEIELDMVITAIKQGLRITEIPTTELVRHGGRPKLRTFRDGWANLLWYLREAVR